MENLIVIIVLFACISGIVDAWKRELYLWSVVWAGCFAFTTWIWTLL